MSVDFSERLSASCRDRACLITTVLHLTSSPKISIASRATCGAVVVWPERCSSEYLPTQNLKNNERRVALLSFVCSVSGTAAHARRNIWVVTEVDTVTPHSRDQKNRRDDDVPCAFAVTRYQRATSTSQPSPLLTRPSENPCSPARSGGYAWLHRVPGASAVSPPPPFP